MSQNYNQYNMGPQPATGGDMAGNQMISQGFNQPYQGSQNPNMMQQMGNQQGYMSQQQQFNTRWVI